MKNKLLLSIFILCCTIQCRAQIILPDDNFVTGWTTSGKTLRFVGADLFNYIDGGAELFHEFGFKQLLAQGYKQQGSEILLEVYQMESPEAALGVYLMKCGEETPIEKINTRNSGNKYQFMMVKGSYFILINSFAGSEKLIPVMTSLAQQTLKFIPAERPIKILDNLPKQNLIVGSELLVRGIYGLQPIYTFGEGDILQLNGETFGIIGEYKDAENGKYTLIIINYKNSNNSSAVFSNLLINLDPYLTVLDKWENGFIFKDFQNKFGLAILKDAVIQIKIKLDKKPESTPKLDRQELKSP